MMIRENKLEPLVKWAGGKTRELKYIHPSMPTNFDRFFEPFLGGGALYFSIEENVKKIVNDFSRELVSLYEMVKKQDKQFLDSIQEIARYWDLLNKITKINENAVISIYKQYSNDSLSSR